MCGTNNVEKKRWKYFQSYEKRTGRNSELANSGSGAIPWLSNII